MNQTCQNCSAKFETSDTDIAFLKKLSPEIDGVTYEFPASEYCPPCRQMQRMSFRNERTLYHRTCDVTGKKIISVSPPDSPFKVCDKDYWYSDTFEALDYGRDFDFSKPFFEQFLALEKDIPLPSLRNEMSENSDYNNDIRDCQNCYLCARTHMSRNLMYAYRGNKSLDSIDCMQITKCELCYECVECVSCYNSKYLFFCSDCTDCSFLLDCRNCMNCFMCTNLRSKQYCFLNQQLTKEAYEKKLAEFDFGSYAMVKRAYEMFAEIKKKTIQRALMIVNSEDCTGDNLLDCKNCHMCFGAQSTNSGRYLWDVKLYTDGMDAYSGGRNSELVYFTTAVADSYNVQFCVRASECNNILYSFYINSSKDIFGCIGVRGKKYCILNKQYTLEEFTELLPKIISHMKKTGEWGKFFPAECSPFGYNDTSAMENFPLTEKEAVKKGYRWQPRDPKEYQKQTYKLPDNAIHTKDDIIEQILACEDCGKNYKVMPQELAYLRKHVIALPRQCHDCRYKRRLGTKNPPILREDNCKKCGKQIETTFPKDTEMQIYCEDCYLKAVY